jgi:hypothetical protein
MSNKHARTSATRILALPYDVELHMWSMLDLLGLMTVRALARAVKGRVQSYIARTVSLTLLRSSLECPFPGARRNGFRLMCATARSLKHLCIGDARASVPDKVQVPDASAVAEAEHMLLALIKQCRATLTYVDIPVIWRTPAVMSALISCPGLTNLSMCGIDMDPTLINSIVRSAIVACPRMEQLALSVNDATSVTTQTLKLALSAGRVFAQPPSHPALDSPTHP